MDLVLLSSRSGERSIAILCLCEERPDPEERPLVGVASMSGGVLWTNGSILYMSSVHLFSDDADRLFGTLACRKTNERYLDLSELAKHSPLLPTYSLPWNTPHRCPRHGKGAGYGCEGL